jgi:hypothetical protein
VNGPYTLVHKEPVVAVPLLEVVWIEGHPLVPYRALVVGHGSSMLTNCLRQPEMFRHDHFSLGSRGDPRSDAMHFS